MPTPVRARDPTGKEVRQELTKLAFCAYKNIAIEPSPYVIYLELYYKLHALRRIGFSHNTHDYDPFTLEVISFIETQIAKMESDELKQKATTSHGHPRRS